MKFLIAILTIILLCFNNSFGQGDWIYLNYNLKQTETIDSADIKIQYLLDSSDLKVYRAVDIKNEYFGFLHAKDDKLQSAQIVFNYDSGHLRSIGTFQKGLKEGIWTEYYYNGQVDNSGFYEKGKLNGEWTWYFENGQMSSREFYEMDELKSVEMWDESGIQVTVPENNVQMPRLKIDDRDLQALRYMILKEMRYPEIAVKNKIEGRVLVQFTIDKNGNMYNERVIKGVNEDLDMEALRVIRLADKWIPGLVHNRPAAFRFTYTLSFKL